MNTLPKKQQYDSPEIRRINLDNEISLILVSGNPGDPFSQSDIAMPEFFKTNPFSDGIG